MLDKTGTLTYGQPEIRVLLPAPGVDDGLLLDTAGSAELRSEHPLGKTIVAYARQLGWALREPEHFGYSPGRGIDAVLGSEQVLVGNQALLRAHGVAVPAHVFARHPEASEVLVARAGRFLGAIVIADRARPEAQQAVRAIQAMGIKTILLTGDARPTGEPLIAPSKRLSLPLAFSLER